MELLRWLEKLDMDDVAFAGGKGARLGALLRAGFPVPRGFVLLTPAYQSFVEVNGLHSGLASLAAEVQADQPASAEAASVSIRALFTDAIIPDDTARAILTAYEQLGGGPVAIRSSAISEDSPHASYAGQQDSFLNVIGPEQVLATVKLCWTSLWTARAIAYRTRQIEGPAKIGMAVVIQQMVPAEISGVLFTANPVSGARKEMVINAAWGLGEAIVGGWVTPDSVVVDKATGEAKKTQVGDKTVMAAQTGEGTTLVPVAPHKQRQAALTPAQIAELTRLGADIEALFGGPQDIEWAFTGGKAFVLQSRPVTRLPSAQAESPDPNRRQVAPGDDAWDRKDEMPPQPFDLWTRTNFGENLPYPVSPLTASVLPALYGQSQSEPAKSADKKQIARRFYGRLYVNEGAIMHTLSEEYGLPSGIIDALWGSRRRGLHSSGGRFRPLRLLRRVPSLLRAAAQQTKQRGPKQKPEELFAEIDRWSDDLRERDLTSLDDRTLWAEVMPVWRERGARVLSKNIAISTSAVFLYALLERLVGWWSGSRDVTHDLVSGLSGVYSAEIGAALWQMAQTLQNAGVASVALATSPTETLSRLRDLPEAQPAIAQLEEFLHRHGHRCPNEVELLNPRWSDAPEQVIAMLAGYLAAGGSADPSEAGRRRSERREKAIGLVESRVGPLRRAIFRFVLKKTQQAVRMRDNSRYYVAKFYSPLRRLFAHVGQRWIDRGWLAQPDDIFFLTMSEIETVIVEGAPVVGEKDLRAAVADRRLAYDYWYKVVAPEVIGPDGIPVVEAVPAEDFLPGVAASGGRVSGIARLVSDPHEAAKLRPGDILVTQATDPGWTPVFPLVSGLVLEIGGQLSHGAIVAREYGVPAVVNVQGALRRIQDGQTITVDGTLGRVILHS